MLYAETWDGGWSVLCDLRLDGHSLTTGEPIAAIGQAGSRGRRSKLAGEAEAFRLERCALLRHAVQRH